MQQKIEANVHAFSAHHQQMPSSAAERPSSMFKQSSY